MGLIRICWSPGKLDTDSFLAASVAFVDCLVLLRSLSSCSPTGYGTRGSHGIILERLFTPIYHYRAMSFSSSRNTYLGFPLNSLFYPVISGRGECFLSFGLGISSWPTDWG